MVLEVATEAQHTCMCGCILVACSVFQIAGWCGCTFVVRRRAEIETAKVCAWRVDVLLVC